jgi:DNA-binding GntR family transcriptional regulator
MSLPDTKIRRIVDFVVASISSGTLRNGDQVPSERALAEQFQVSLGTVRRALTELEHRGVIDKQHGRGNFVRGLGSSMDARYVRFRDARGREIPVFWHVLRHVKATPDRGLTDFFGGSIPLMRIDRQVDVNGQFAMFSQFYLPETSFQKLAGELEEGSNLRNLIAERLALPTLRVEQLLGFKRMTAAVAQALHRGAGEMAVLLELRGYTVDEQPVYLQRIFSEPFEGATLVIDTSR